MLLQLGIIYHSDKYRLSIIPGLVKRKLIGWTILRLCGIYGRGV
jgi:hypothetical protein